VIASAKDLDARRFRAALDREPPIFARNACAGLGPIAVVESTGARADRIAALAPALDALASVRAHAPPWRSVWVEFPDSDEGRPRSTLARALQARLETALKGDGRLSEASSRRLHVLLADERHALVGTRDVRTSRWPLGIPRLARPHAAPSRSVQKLAEAFVVFLGAAERELVRPGQRAVDLGAAPGGWSWLLAQRGLRVTAVDNGALKGEVARDPLVTHVRADGLRFRPPRPVAWLFCDIVEQPLRIAELVAAWIADGVARRAIFNLKLPMKRRYDEIRRCEAAIERRLGRVDATLALRHLYHDREEVTGYLARVE
jgi:23S rRNA (cytidine2498-2'-O)-methyltransferase